MIKENLFIKFSRGYLFFLLILILALPGKGFSQGKEKNEAKNKKGNSVAVESFRPEHVAFNVPDPVKQVKWYVENLGMKVMREGTPPTYTFFIADSGKHMMMELFHNTDYPELDFAKLDYNSLHLAFVVNNIKATEEKLLAAGAKVAQELFKTPTGDQVMVLHDPWGLPIQFVERVNPMFKYTGVRLEHIEFNVPDTHAKAKWYVDNLGMKVVRDAGAPTFNMFISDPGKNMMVELNQNKDFPMIDFKTISHQAIHLAFMVKDIDVVKKDLMKAGATFVVEETTPAGDKVLMLRDPWGQPIQFIKRANPMLK